MRTCPKCGAMYTESDLRTMCSSCLVNLVPAKDASPLDAMAAPGPISLGPISAPGATVDTPPTPEWILEPPPPPSIAGLELSAPPEPVMPDITLPTMPDLAPPEPMTVAMPLVDAPLPVEGPVPAAPEPPEQGPVPAAPPPPEQGPVPGAPEPPSGPLPPLEATPAAPPIVPSFTSLREQPTGPVPPLEAAPPIVPSFTPLREPPAKPVVAKPPVVAPPAPRRPVAPAMPASTLAEGDPGFTALPLPGDLVANARGKGIAIGVLAGIVGFIALVILFATETEKFNFFTLLCVAGFTIGAVALLRRAIYLSAIDTVKIIPQAVARPGAPLPVKIIIATLRDLPITDVELTLQAEERTEKRGENGSATRYTCYAQTTRVSTPATWPGGKEVSFQATPLIPADAVPTFTGRANRLEWSLHLWVGIPGWYPDIRANGPLTMHTVVVGAPAPAITPRVMALPELQGMQARLTLPCGDDEGVPLLQLGQEYPFTLAINPAETNNGHRVRVELSYLITGDGDREERTVASVACFPGGWVAGTPMEQRGVLALPSDSPITYTGLRFRTRWQLTVRHEAPWQFDRIQRIEVHVSPGTMPAGG